MRTLSKILLPVLCGLGLALSAGCSSLKTPATADVAVSNAAVENAVGAGGSQYAPIEMNAARTKLAQAREALARKDYKLAISLADQSKADAKLAQGKANSAKAKAAADALDEDIQVLREEIQRNNQQR
jgi:hypothetical protein